MHNSYGVCHHYIFHSMSDTDLILTSLCQCQLHNQYSVEVQHLTLILLQSSESVIALRSQQFTVQRWQISVKNAAKFISDRIYDQKPTVSPDEFMTKFAAVARFPNHEHKADDDICAILNAYRRSESNPDPCRIDREICRILAASNPVEKSPLHHDVINRILQQLFNQYQFSLGDLFRITEHSKVLALYHGDGLKINEYLADDNLSILLYGSIKVFDSIEIGELHPPEIFNMKSLNLDDDKYAKLICDRDCIMLIITLSDYQRIFGDKHFNSIVHRRNLINQNLIFRQISNSALTVISLSSSCYHIDSNQVIIEQGQPIANKIFVIGSGVVRMIIELPADIAEAHRASTCRPRLKPRSCNTAMNRSHLQLLPPTLSSQQNSALNLPIRGALVFTQRHREPLRTMIHSTKNIQKGVFVEIAQLTSGDIFGEESLLISVDQHTPEPFQISVLSSSGPVWLITIPKHVLIRHLPASIISRLTSLMKNNITRRQILFHLEECERWKTYCSNLPKNPLQIFTESPACNVGISSLFKHRFWAHRHTDFQELVQCDESVQARARLLKERIAFIIDSIEIRTDTEASISSLEDLSDAEIEKRRAEFSIENIAELLLEPHDNT